MFSKLIFIQKMLFKKLFIDSFQSEIVEITIVISHLDLSQIIIKWSFKLNETQYEKLNMTIKFKN